MTIALPDSRQAVADAIKAHRVAHLRIEAERLALAAHWADLHPVDDGGEAIPRPPGAPKGKPAGADGTPLVDEFAAGELGVLLGIHPFGAASMMTDAMNLRHRHPQLWARVQRGEVIGWVASKTARLVASADLDVNKARWVDGATHGYASSLPPSRYFALIEAKIIEADLEAAERRRRAYERAQFVRVGQSTEHGIKNIVTRAAAGDVVLFDAIVQRIADIFKLKGSLDCLDLRRAKAIGILANPAEAIQLLAWQERQATAEATPEGEPRQRTNDPAVNAAFAEKLAEIEPRKLLPPATLVVHVSQGSLASGSGVARVEGIGPVTLGQACDWLKRRDVMVQPVLDPLGQPPVDADEVPRKMAASIRLLLPFEAFPHATESSRKAELDHTIPYDKTGPPGQTRVDNLGPLTKRHHRIKTHGPGWQLRQPSSGVYLWRSPTGFWTRVDRRGTHRIGTRLSMMEEHVRTILHDYLP